MDLDFCFGHWVEKHGKPGYQSISSGSVEYGVGAPDIGDDNHKEEETGTAVECLQ